SPARHELVLGAGERRSLRDPFGLHWDVVGQGISRYAAESREVLALAVELRQGSGAPRLVTSELRQYYDARGLPLGGVVTTAGRAGTPLEEVRVLLVEAPSEERVRLRVTFAPLVWLAWLGGGLLVLGGVLALLPAPHAVRAGEAAGEASRTTAAIPPHAESAP
ncbi:MAG TPA: hypothetical protein VFX50_10535, partial [Gemmatimonadales bacterium]|nr:hypothetical protein [Gemmatimonadales bacterium]